MDSSMINFAGYVIAAMVVATLFFSIMPRLLGDTLTGSPSRGKSTAIFLLDLVGVIIILILILIGLANLNDNAQWMAILITVASGAFIFISEGWFQDALGGLSLQLNGLYKIDDFVSIGGNRGRVVRLGLFRTEIETLELDIISIRNANVLQEQVINHSRVEFREVSIIVHTAGYGEYEEDIHAYMDAVQTVVDRVQSEICPEAIKHPRLTTGTYFMEFGSSSDFINVIFYTYDEDYAYRIAVSAMHVAMAADLRPRGVILGQVNANTIDNVLAYQRVS